MFLVVFAERRNAVQEKPAMLLVFVAERRGVVLLKDHLESLLKQSLLKGSLLKGSLLKESLLK
jgi:hypothetical protein